MITMTPIAPVTDAITLADVRAMAIDSVLKMPSHTVDNSSLDYAINAAGNEFMRQVKPVRNSFTVTTIEGQYTVSVSENQFLPRYVLEAFLIQNGTKILLKSEDKNSVLRDLIHPVNGKPSKFSFKDNDTCLLYPVPDGEYTIQFNWWEPFVKWEIGTGSPETVPINIPEDMLNGVVFHGIPAYFERGTEKSNITARAEARFREHIRQCRGIKDSTSSSVVILES